MENLLLRIFIIAGKLSLVFLGALLFTFAFLHIVFLVE